LGSASIGAKHRFTGAPDRPQLSLSVVEQQRHPRESCSIRERQRAGHNAPPVVDCRAG
jgi:hypothetical protein